MPITKQNAATCHQIGLAHADIEPQKNCTDPKDDNFFNARFKHVHENSDNNGM